MPRSCTVTLMRALAIVNGASLRVPLMARLDAKTAAASRWQARLRHALIGLAAGIALTPVTVLAQKPAATTSTSTFGGLGTTTMDSPFKDFYVIVGASVTNDSNLFRNSSPQSETITSGNIGLRLDKSWSLQNVQLDISKTYNRYDRFKYLDFDGLNYSGAWNWRFGTRLSGRLSASRSESLAPFEDTLGIARNMRISKNEAFDLDFWAYGGWHILMGVSRSDQTSEQNTFSRDPDFNSTSSNIGVKYLTRAGNSITARWRTTDGQETNSPLATMNSDYTEDVAELSAQWQMTGASSLSGRIGWLDRTYNSPGRSNFSGPSSSLNYSWVPGGNLSLTASASRSTEPLQDFNASYRQVDTLTLSPALRLTEKTRVILLLSHQKDTDKDAQVVSPSGPRRDTTNIGSIGVDWAATRALRFNASVERRQRSSTYLLNEYDATITRIGATLFF